MPPTALTYLGYFEIETMLWSQHSVPTLNLLIDTDASLDYEDVERLANHQEEIYNS